VPPTLAAPSYRYDRDTQKGVTILKSSCPNSATAPGASVEATTSYLAGGGRALWSAGRSWMGKGFLALLDQGLISGSNFLVGILLARRLLPGQYGGYALAFEFFLGLAVVYGALVLEPMTVLGASVYRGCLQEYLGILLRIHLRIAMVAVVVLGGSALAAYEFGASRSLPSALAGVTLAGPCVLLFWLARRTFYIKLAPRTAALGASLYCAVLLVGLLVAYRRLSPFLVFLLMALGALAVSPFLFMRLKPSLRPTAGYPTLGEVVEKHWEYGRWALASSVVIWSSSAVFYPLLSAYRGLAQTGALKALMNFYSPIAQASVALSLLSLPYASRISHQSGPARVRSVGWKLTWLYAGGAAIYWLVILPFRGTVLHILYAGKYSEVASLLPLLALASVLRIAATAQAISLRAMQLPFLVFLAYGACSVVAGVMGFPAISAFGLRGAVLTLVVSSAVALVVAQSLVRYALHHQPEVRIERRRSSSSLTMNSSANVVNGIREKVASALNTSPSSVAVDRWRFSGEPCVLLHCRGSWVGGRFFAKILLADPYPNELRVALPLGDGVSLDTQHRPVEMQIENEWNMTKELGALGGPGFVPAPLAKSIKGRTLVWEEVAGIRLDYLVRNCRWADPRGNTTEAALFQAGRWLRRVHDGSFRGSEIVDMGAVSEGIRELGQQNGATSPSRYTLGALQLLQTARAAVGEDKLEFPVVLSHGDFLLPNLLWNKTSRQLLVFDFEHCGYRNACHDLMAMVFSLRSQLLNPLVPKSAIKRAEESFWNGYGSVSPAMLAFTGAMASARILYASLPRLATRRKRRGWIAGMNAALYKAVFETFVITRRLGVTIAPAALGLTGGAGAPIGKNSPP
jgi:O-antigen/teichoic acid export membrane protein